MKRLIYGLIFVALLLCGCHSSKSTVIVPTTKIDTLYVATHTLDSIYLHDSIFTMVKGDTITTDRWHTLTRYIYKTDTVNHNSVDSIPVVVEVPKIVKEKYVPIHIKFLAILGSITFLGLIIIGIVKFNDIKSFIGL